MLGRFGVDVLMDFGRCVQDDLLEELGWMFDGLRMSFAGFVMDDNKCFVDFD